MAARCELQASGDAGPGINAHHQEHGVVDLEGPHDVGVFAGRQARQAEAVMHDRVGQDPLHPIGVLFPDQDFAGEILGDLAVDHAVPAEAVGDRDDGAAPDRDRRIEHDQESHQVLGGDLHQAKAASVNMPGTVTNLPNPAVHRRLDQQTDTDCQQINHQESPRGAHEASGDQSPDGFSEQHLASANRLDYTLRCDSRVKEVEDVRTPSQQVHKRVERNRRNRLCSRIKPK